MAALRGWEEVLGRQLTAVGFQNQKACPAGGVRGECFYGPGSDLWLVAFRFRGDKFPHVHWHLPVHSGPAMLPAIAVQNTLFPLGRV